MDKFFENMNIKIRLYRQ